MSKEFDEALEREHAKTHGHARSPHWPAVERRFRAGHSTCAVCGGAVSLQVHHVVPFHENPALELDEGNLITLCEAAGLDCHLRVGHAGDFHAENSNVRADAAAILIEPARRDEIIARILARRKAERECES